MKPEDQRLAIARACNWKWDEFTIWTPDHKQFNRYHPIVPTRDQLYDLIPDYLNDLNACHDAAETLPVDKRHSFCKTLAEITSEGAPFTWRGFAYANATAPQRCEALLRALGLWKD